MKRNSERGFTMIELIIGTGVLLSVLTGALYFFARSQAIYTNERGTLDMVQDVRVVFDHLTSEIRVAGSGLHDCSGVVSGTASQLTIRGDFNNTTTIVNGLGVSINGVLNVGTASGFAVGQTVSLLNPYTNAFGLAKVKSVDSAQNQIAIDQSTFLPITSGADLLSLVPIINGFPGGTVINSIERRTYVIKTGGDKKGEITRTVSSETTKVSGVILQPEETIARSVLTPAGDAGLKFTYFDAANNALPFNSSGYVDASKVAKVQVDLQARSVNPDLDSKQYRTLKIKTLVQVRSQY